MSSVCGRLAEIPVLDFGIPFSVGHTAVVFPWSTLYWIYSSLQPLWLCSLSAGAASVQWLQLLWGLGAEKAVPTSSLVDRVEVSLTGHEETT